MTGQFSVCKRPGCGKPLPVSHGPGRARQFCSPECARRYHNDARGPAPRTAPAEPADPFAALESLLRQLTVTVRAIREQAADTGQQVESLNAALAQTREELRAARTELERRAAGSP
ncbi:MAG TPA: hypothetical protein VK817_03355 [Trebonia sp.]|nr:hypothetical protein [Trebonia sp.]